MSDITVLTSICGGKDELRDQVQGSAHFIAYMDVPQRTTMWEIRKAYDRFKDPRRNSRMPKLLSHQFCETEYSIWIDGNATLLRPPEELVERYLQDSDLAVFKHPKRDCIYGEATKCAVAGLDDPEVIIEQARTYELAGFAKNKGLCECMFIVRRHTPKVKAFNDAWFSEYARHSVRDQISFMYAVDQVGLKINVIDLEWRLSTDKLSAYRGDFYKMEPHIILNPSING